MHPRGPDHPSPRSPADDNAGDDRTRASGHDGEIRVRGKGRKVRVSHARVAEQVAGAHLNTVRELLGHADAQTAAKYDHRGGH